MAENEESTVKEYTPVEINLTTLLEAGAHFGHKAERWNPKMLPYIYGKRGDVYVINLDLTLESWNKCRQVIKKFAAEGKTFLFVGTKDQAKDIVASAAERCNSFYINNRWLGGTLTNFETIKRSIAKMNKLEELLKEAEDPESKVKIGKKERLQIRRKLDNLSVNLDGIRDMKKHPDVLFLVDINKDVNAIAEAKCLHIPVVSLVDTNCDPNTIDYPIPCNDDAKGAIYLFVNAIADAVLEGKVEYEKAVEAAQKEAAKEQSSNSTEEVVEVEQATATN